MHIIFGKDPLATANPFVRQCTDFNEIASTPEDSPSIATMGLIKKAGEMLCSVLGNQITQDN